MTQIEHKQWLMYVMEHAEKLRALGVTYIQAAGYVAKFAPADKEYPEEQAMAEDIEAELTQFPHPDPLRDDATYLGGRMPQRGRRRK